MHFPAFHVQLPFLLISFCDKDFAEKFKPVLHVEKITNKNTNQKEHLRTLYWPYPTKANLIASPGRDSNIRILCGYECWVSFWLVGLGSIGHNSSVPAVAIPLRGSHFSCHRGRAAPNTLNDLSPWRNQPSEWDRPPPVEQDWTKTQGKWYHMPRLDQ